MDITGEVTISIESFRELLEKAKKLENLEEDRISAEDKALEMIKRDREKMKDEIMEIIETINESEAQPIFREIEDLDITDKEADTKFQEAIANFKIVINPQKLKRLIQKSICGKWRKDESLIDIAYADEETLNKMEVVIAGKEK